MRNFKKRQTRDLVWVPIQVAVLALVTSAVFITLNAVRLEPMESVSVYTARKTDPHAVRSNHAAADRLQR